MSLRGLDKSRGIVYNFYMGPKNYKFIRLEADVYAELKDFSLGHETYSNAVWRLLRLNEQMRKMLKTLGGVLPEPRERR